MTKAMPRRKPAAILAADVIGFRKLMGESEDRTLQQRRYVQADPGIRFDGFRRSRRYQRRLWLHRLSFSLAALLYQL